jgi:hypothetical protein
MRRHSRNDQVSEERQQRLLAYFEDARTSDREKGVIVLMLGGHAYVYLLLAGAEVTWIAVMAARVWRRRDDGPLGAVRTGLHKPTLAAFLAADVGYLVLRRVLRASIDRRLALRP